MYKTNIDFSQAIVFASSQGSAHENKAVSVFIEEIEKRTKVKFPVVHDLPAKARPVIIIGLQDFVLSAAEKFPKLHKQLNKLAVPGAEGYRIAVSSSDGVPVIAVAGADDRGILYGVGKLLRKMEWHNGEVGFPASFTVSSTPEFSIRGHQLGYRPKTNAYDAWTPEIYDQYIRDLALFGANGIELMPPRTDDDPTSIHMKYDAMDMMCRVSEIIHSYGLEVWVWYPDMADEYVKEETIAFEEAERDDVFARVPYIDHVFIPGGDPGELDPGPLFWWGERVNSILIKHHPKAKMWLSPQTFTPSRNWADAFYAELEKEPEWLYGVVFGPWERDPAEVLRKKTPARYPIRNYPDITHSFRCQFPIYKWDLPMALTLGRECINPRPYDEKLIHNTYKDYFVGSLSYSEGINDDVNKFIWSDQDWDSSTPAVETLRDFGRLFIDYDMADDIAQGLIALERNFQGPLAENENVDTCLMQWQAMEKKVSGWAVNNYRFEMGLIRAYYDAYQKNRYIYEKSLEKQAREVLADCRKLGPEASIDAALEILNRARTQPVCVGWHRRIDELADLLFEHIGEQLTVTRHAALHFGRGGFVECIDIPLNDYRFLNKKLNEIRTMKSPADILGSANPSAPSDKMGVVFSGDDEFRCKKIEELLNRTNPGPGGFYDNMGSWSSWHRIMDHDNFEKDPGYLNSSLASFVVQPPHDEEDDNNNPLAWQLLACTMYGTPLVVKYEDLDPDADYMLRTTYVGYFGKHIKLVAGEKDLIHDFIVTSKKFLNMEFVLPKKVYANGKLKLTFTAPDGERGANVAEIWIVKLPKML